MAKVAVEKKWTLSSACAAMISLPALAACGATATQGDDDDALTVYSGRSEGNVEELFEQFEEDTGIELDVRYGDSAELTSQILEEGEATPADVYFTLEVGGINALNDQGYIATLPDHILEMVPESFQVPDGSWVGTAARARVIGYNPENISVDDLPESAYELTEPEWEGRLGIAPSNSSFQAFLSGFRALEGDEATQQWLNDIAANDPELFDNNRAIIEGIEQGVVDVGLVNHYYHIRQIEEDGAENVDWNTHYVTGGDPIGIPVIAGISVLEGSQMQEEAHELIEFLLSEEAQQYFADETHEYPVVDGIQSQHDELVPLGELGTPPVELAEVADMERTLEMLRDAGLL